MANKKSLWKQIYLWFYRLGMSIKYAWKYKIVEGIMRFLRLDVCHLCYEMLDKYRSLIPYPDDPSEKHLGYTYAEGFFDDYRKLMKRILRVGFKVRGNLDGVIDGVCYGNWERIWETDDDKAMPFEDLFNETCCEIAYCSDRMSWDRFMRINWRYQRLKDRMGRWE